ncbi:hypothetical protein F4810DRAFT_707849 [Camillea tinctor]|nr:hypothetical protein F4810DRAFT_707849 [Camillea tinctor]
MSKNIFRIFDPRVLRNDETNYAELNGNSYRDRKDAYIKSLETEITRSRASEATLIFESEKLRNRVNTLTKMLLQNGIDIPAQEDSASLVGHSNPEMYAHEIRSNAKDNFIHGKEMITEHDVLFDTRAPGSSSAIGRRIDLPLRQDHQRKEILYTESPPETQNTPSSSFTNNTRLCELDPAILGMDFVLTLESPCLGHLHGDPDQPDEPNGHALTTSAQIEFSTPLSYLRPHEPRDKPGHQAPAAVLSRLLDLATNLCADGELTPIQAWNYVRCQPHFGGVEVRSLRNLEERLRKTVKCHGFGAVIESSALEEAVHETLLIGQSF